MKGLFRLSSLAIMGMGKNTGKTSFLNLIIEEARVHHKEKVLALTSIGRDGEERDLVTKGDKPKIYISEGTLIATSEELLSRCDVTKEIMESTRIFSALGRIIIFRALSDGFVEIAGPSRSSDLLEIEKSMRRIEEHCLFIVDGALSRMSFSTRTEGAVLCTGVSVSQSQDKILEKTRNALKSLTLPVTKHSLPKEAGRAFVKNGNWERVQGELALSLGKEIRKVLSNDTEAIYIKGAATDQLFTELLADEHFRNRDFILADGTSLLISPEMMSRLSRRKISLQVVEEIRVEEIIVNPYDQGGFEVDIEKLIGRIQKETEIPVKSLRVWKEGK
ncbi:hypothetical protein J3A84_14790 [Proteiniclasticum sp. SCR006]|uniref:Uncharacterized protein n=2 Tax=Proteiniclasticum TaxID=1155385 RepID=A0A939HEY5_9CLOT|nr:hypothetical protein [Proteiniclasticum aestuarii]MBO1266300.1 hypothetical protein [Proteiniclasticum aestuarii]